MNGVVETIALSGNDSINFANSIFRPTHSEIVAVREKINLLDESIELTDNENGYIANIPALDLSFLDEVSEDSHTFTIDITVNVKSNSENYFINENDPRNQMVKIKTNKNYCDSVDSNLIMIAA